jgi:hypothetical protein
MSHCLLFFLVCTHPRVSGCNLIWFVITAVISSADSIIIWFSAGADKLFNVWTKLGELDTFEIQAVAEDYRDW